MTNKELIEKIANTKSFKKKYNISPEDINLITSTAGTEGKIELKVLYTIINKNSTSTSSVNTVTNQVYKILKNKFNI